MIPAERGAGDALHRPPAPEPLRGVQRLVQSARDGWSVGGLAFDFARRARPMRSYVAGAFAVLLVLHVAIGAAGVALRHDGTLGERIVFGVLAAYIVAVGSNAAAVGLAAIADELLAGRDPRPALGWRLARRRLPQVAGWALLVVAVGVPARLLTRWGVDQLGAALLGFGWGVLTLFVIPAIALAGDGPLEAARRSLRLVSRRWGTQIAGMVSVWVRPALFVGVPGAALLLTGLLLARAGTDLLGWALAVGGVIALAIAYALMVSARAVLAVALFRYASDGRATNAFAPAQLERVLRGPSPAILRVARRLDGERARQIRSKLTDGCSGDSPG